MLFFFNLLCFLAKSGYKILIFLVSLCNNNNIIELYHIKQNRKRLNYMEVSKNPNEKVKQILDRNY